jgi:ribonucleoside-diphosphate reductase alpha chain
MTGRTRLPQRRAAETFSLNLAGRRFEASVGTDAEGHPREVFLKGGKSGTELDILLGDLGVAISIALQYGAPADVLAHGFLRNADRTPAGVAAAAMDKVVALAAERDAGDDDAS